MYYRALNSKSRVWDPEEADVIIVPVLAIMSKGCTGGKRWDIHCHDMHCINPQDVLDAMA